MAPPTPSPAAAGKLVALASFPWLSPLASTTFVKAKVTPALTLNSRTALLPLMTTARSLASSDTLLVTLIVLPRVIVPLQQNRTVPPRDIAARSPASSQATSTLLPEHALGMDNAAGWLVAVP